MYRLIFKEAARELKKLRKVHAQKTSLNHVFDFDNQNRPHYCMKGR